MGRPAEHESLADLSVGDYLIRLAGRTSMPAGGVVCAIQAAQAAALVAMAARFSSADDSTAPLAAEADRLIAAGLRLAEEDQRSYAAVSAAYALPKADPERRTVLAKALTDASRPAAGVLSLVDEVVTLAERLVPALNPTLRADLAVAADVAIAAASGARTTIEANLGGLPAGAERDPVFASLDEVDQILARTTVVRESVRRKNASEPAHPT